MKKMLYALACIGVVLTLLSAENFVLPKKEIIKKKPRITEEHIITNIGDQLQESAVLRKAIAEIDASSLDNVKSNPFKNASQQERQQYDECTQKMRNALQECSQCIIEQQSIRKRCCKR